MDFHHTWWKDGGMIRGRNPFNFGADPYKGADPGTFKSLSLTLREKNLSYLEGWLGLIQIS